MAYTVAVAQYGHPSFKVKHWSIVVLFDDENGLSYQITGSTSTYKLKEVEPTNLSTSSAYLGNVTVGTVDQGRLVEFGQTITNGQIVLGNPAWNCQHWVVERLNDLRNESFDIQDVDHATLLSRLSQ